MSVITISEESFQILLETSKRMKSDITLLTHDGQIYGSNGFVNEGDKIFDVGCVKRVTSGGNGIRINESVGIDIAIQSKNIIALGKAQGSGLELHYIPYSSAYMCDFVKRGDQQYIAFDGERLSRIIGDGFYDRHVNVSVPIFTNLDISDYEPFLNIINMSATEGGGIVNYNGIPIFTVGNILGVNKGDKVFLSADRITNVHANVLFVVSKAKKNYNLEVKYTVLI